MLEAGEDPRFIARRLVVHATEDVGLADPTALLAATAAAQAVQLIGLPEARINLAQATVHLALAPKSNAVVRAIDAAQADVRAGLAGAVPAALRDAHYPGAAKVGAGSATATRPTTRTASRPSSTRRTSSSAATTTRPAGRGAERAILERLVRLRDIIRGTRHPIGSSDSVLARGGGPMSGGEIAALIAAIAFVLLVLLLAVPLLKLGRTLDEATLAVRKTHDGVGPLLTDAQQHRRVDQPAARPRRGHRQERQLDDEQRRRDDGDRVEHPRQPDDQGRGVHLRRAQDRADRRDADAVKAARRKHRADRRAK